MKHGEWNMKCLSPCLQSLVSPLVMILWYQVSYVRLGTCEGEGRRGFSGDWGGTEGIGNVVQRLQNEIADLPDPFRSTTGLHTILQIFENAHH
ncbi:hypothetical protein GBAR_LOCUS2248, partial [Geodia barretti]